MALGASPDVGLVQAREAVARNRALIASGGDPLAEKRRATVPSFREAAERVFEANRPRWRNSKHTVTWRQSLERHAYPVLGNMPADAIDQEDVLRVLTPIWGTTPETARRVRQRIRTILKWAQAHRFVEHNAAGEAIDGALPAMPKVKNHLRALPYQEVGGLIDAVRQSQVSLAAKWCLEFLILTAVRSGEARGAAWSEIDMDAATWSTSGRYWSVGSFGLDTTADTDQDSEEVPVSRFVASRVTAWSAVLGDQRLRAYGARHRT